MFMDRFLLSGDFGFFGVYAEFMRASKVYRSACIVHDRSRDRLGRFGVNIFCERCL